VPRFVFALFASVAVTVTLARLAPQSAAPAGAVPPTEPRPAGMRHSALWLPELRRYQYSRRDALREGTDFRSRLNLALVQESRQKLYRVTIRERPEPVALEQFQSWLFHVDDVQGRAVAGAVVNVKGGMPQHGHGLPVRPRVQPASQPGDYRVDGLQFSMPGWWEVSVYVSKERREDTATFNIFLE
jgi:hypothetical protein